MTKDARDQIHSASEMLAIAETETNRGAALQLIVSARKCLLRAMKDDTDTEAKIEALNNALASQERLAERIAGEMRGDEKVELIEMRSSEGQSLRGKEYVAREVLTKRLAWADELSPIEPTAEADAAERFSKDRAERRTK